MPSPEEGKERLDYLRQHGDSAYAFSFKHIFSVPAEKKHLELESESFPAEVGDSYIDGDKIA